LFEEKDKIVDWVVTFIIVVVGTVIANLASRRLERTELVWPITFATLVTLSLLVYLITRGIRKRRTKHPLRVEKQHIFVAITEHGALEKVLTETMVKNVGREHIMKRNHSIRSSSGALGQVKIKAYDRHGPLQDPEIREHTPYVIDFYVVFRKPLSKKDGVYTYFYETNKIPNFYPNYPHSSSAGWEYTPQQPVSLFEIEIVHPEGYDVRSASFTEKLNNKIISSPNSYRKGARQVTFDSIRHLSAGSYYLEWHYS